MRILLILLFLFAPAAMAQEAAVPPPVVTGDFKDLKHTGSNRIDKVINAQTILMKDGVIVRLLGIDYPYVKDGEVNDTSVAAKERLEHLLPEKTEVMLYQTRKPAVGRINRMGHVLAHLVNKNTGEWINGALVAEGYAYAVTDISNPEMATQLYALEDKARTGKKGLWMDLSPFGLLNADTASLGDGAFRVVEGTVNRAGTGNNNLYLNFGTDRNKDFTVMITPALRKAFAHRGIDAMALSGQKIRVRGTLREWNGPYMELETPERLEIISPVIPTKAEGSSNGPSAADPSPSLGMTTGGETGQAKP